MTNVPVLITDFSRYLMSRGLADRTVAEYRKYARRWCRWCELAGSDPVRGLQPAHLRAWGRTLPPGRESRINARSAMGHLLRMLDDDPDLAYSMPVPPRPETECKALSTEDADRVHEAAIMVGGREGLAVLLGLYTSARRVEIARWRWSFIDWDDDLLRWPRAKHGRNVPVAMHPTLRDQLERHRDVMGDHSAYVFPGNFGQPHVRPETINIWVNTIGEAAGVKLSPHVLRHTCLAEIVDSTKDLRAAQDIAGHHDPSVTSLYTRTNGERRVAAIASLGYGRRDKRPVDV